VASRQVNGSNSSKTVRRNQYWVLIGNKEYAPALLFDMISFAEMK
jgi:hypothetical protein